MAQPSRQEGDWTFAGIVRFLSTLVLPAGCISNAEIAASAAIGTAKMLHLHRVPYRQPNTAATSDTQVVYRCNGATGTTITFHAGSIAKAVGDSTVTVDLQKSTGGGAFASVLSAPVTLNSSSTLRVPTAGTISVTGLVAGDLLQIVTVATIGTGTLPTGVFASATVEEAAQ